MLARLTVRGFKSFADTTTLRFGTGVNVIVGPNGSGKSNLAEAILWALGEQRAGRLRAGGMADVLYAGGERRAAAPYAEVRLLFDDGDSPDRPAELETARRLTRAGDAHYRLGGGSVRLLDVQEALAARGLGADALAIIRQGQVEAICASTAAQRRAIVDAAAGVAVAKRRRRRAELKLARVDDRLDRARDLAGELVGRARTLTRQAQAAERAADLERRIATAERDVNAARARAAAIAAAWADERFRVADTAAHAAERAREDARAAAAQAEAERGALDERRRAAERRAAALRSAGDRLAGRAEVAAERVAAAERAERQRQRRQAEALARRGELTQALIAADQDLARAERVAEEARVAAATAEAADGQARADRRAAEDAANDAAARAAAAERALTQAERAVNEVVAQHRRATERLAALGDDRPLSEAVSRAQRRREVSLTRHERWRDRVSAAAREAADALALREAAEGRLRQAKAAVRALTPEDDRRGGPMVLGDGIEIVPGGERAVAAALGAYLDAVLSANLSEALAALDAGAPAAVLPVQGESNAPGVPPPGASPVIDLIASCPDETREHLERLLGDSWLVDDIGDVPSDRRATLVTRAGQARDLRTGMVRGADERWARRALHRRALSAQSAAQEQVDSAAAAADAAQAHERAFRRRGRAAQQCAARAEAQLERLQAEWERRLAGLAQARADVDRFASEREQRIATLEAARQERSDAARAADRTAEDLAQARARATHTGAQARATSGAGADARAALAGAKTHRAEVAARLANLAAVADRPPSEAVGLPAARDAVAALQRAIAALAPATARADEARDGLSADLQSHDRTLAGARRAVEAAEASAQAAVRAAHEAQLEAALAAERAAEAGEPPSPEREIPDPDAAAAQLAELTRRRAALGAVNPLAAAERAELAEREEELRDQIQDLEDTAGALREHMSELSGAVAAGFERLFGSLCARFEEVCGLLFPGGHGRLRAVEDPDGEPGIEIEVVPAGKRPRSLALLSGGERSLVALAFCLALAMARPAPFYLLDEVEAALDDVNLRRFLAVVRRLADGGRQFILITHQQPTVEIADALFGVTMGAEGVSQVLSRRLDRAPTASRAETRAHLRAVTGGQGA